MTEISSVPLSVIAPLNEGYLIIRSNAFVLITDPRQWAFSAEAKFYLPGTMRGPRTVKMELEVERGVLGVGWLNGSGCIARASATSDAGATELSLVIPTWTQGRSLVFDNWTDSGNPARGVIKSVKVVQTLKWTRFLGPVD